MRNPGIFFFPQHGRVAHTPKLPLPPLSASGPMEAQCRGLLFPVPFSPARDKMCLFFFRRVRPKEEIHRLFARSVLSVEEVHPQGFFCPFSRKNNRMEEQFLFPFGSASGAACAPPSLKLILEHRGGLTFSFSFEAQRVEMTGTPPLLPFSLPGTSFPSSRSKNRYFSSSFHYVELDHGISMSFPSRSWPCGFNASGLSIMQMVEKKKARVGCSPFWPALFFFLSI